MPLYQRLCLLNSMRVEHSKKALLVLSLVIVSFTIAQNVSAQISEEDELDFIMQVDEKERTNLNFGLHANGLMFFSGKLNLGLLAQFGGYHEIYSLVGLGFFPAFYDGLFTQGSLEKSSKNRSHFFAEAGYTHYLQNEYLNFSYSGLYAEASLKYLQEEFGGTTVETSSHEYAGIKIGGGYSVLLSERSLKQFALKLGGSLDVLGKTSSSNSSGNNTIIIPRAVISCVMRFN